MSSTSFELLIAGSGMAGKALAQALRWAAADQGVELAPVRWVGRDEAISHTADTSIVCIAGPHRLHAPRLLEIRELPGTVICEKPAAVTLSDVDALAGYPRDVAICHGYRMLWGPQEIRRRVQSGDLGELVSIEGRYWQSSAAVGGRADSWKDDQQLNGAYDTLMDLATHWLDIACYICNDYAPRIDVKLGYGNANRPHRDTHVMLHPIWNELPGFASVSKTAHGCGNDLEFHVIGTKASLSWFIADPDVLWVAEGNRKCKMSREESSRSGMRPFHALGWMEGYVAIATSVLSGMRGLPAERIPSLPESLAISRLLIDAAERARPG